jgi:tryptophan synthase alpha chain
VEEPVPLPLAERMQRLRQAGAKAFVPFLTAGYPDADTFLALLRGTRSADLVEVGLPFSDPVADGPSICHATEVALAQGMHAGLLFDLLAAEPRRPPVVVMTYLNPVLAFGAEAFFRRARAAGVLGLILTDVPPEDAGELRRGAAQQDLALVQLVAPTTSEARLAAIAASTNGFLYCVAVTGTTGARGQVGPSARLTVERLRRVTSLPVVVGFGISTPQHVRDTCAFADGAVVGSALVDLVRAHRGAPDLAVRFEARVGELAAAAHAAGQPS